MRALTLLIASLVTFAAAPAQADWRKAETRHFVVYGEGSERDLRNYAVELERFDLLLRSQLSLPPETRQAKLPVYMAANRRRLGQFREDLPDNVGGFYSANFRDTAAFVIPGDGDEILRHEYAHHFMFRNFPGAYPAWFREGFAEFFATATIDGQGRASLGKPDRGRMLALNNLGWLPMERVLSPWSVNRLTREETAAAYAQSWLFVHWLMTDPTRFAALDGYLRDTAGGKSVDDALQANFGQTQAQLTRTLRTYVNAGVRHAELTIPGATPEVTVESLPDTADDIFPLYVNLRDGAATASGPGLLAEARRLSAAGPDDDLRRLTLARAEIFWGDPAAGEAALKPLLDADPARVEALLLMADARIAAGAKLQDPTESERLYRQARAFLQRAYDVDPNNHRIYQTIAYSRRNTADYPTENDVELWRRAVALAPEVASNRPVAAEVMLKHGLYDEAEQVIRPLANDPHGAETSQRIRRILDDIAAQRAAAGGGPASD